MDKEPNEDGNLEFDVETPDEVEAIIKQYGAEGNDFEGGDESPRHVCHVKSPYGYLYFNAPDEEIRNQIWYHWFSEAKEAKRNWEESMDTNEILQGKYEEENS